MNEKKDITILVNSCDSYEDIWYPFFKLFSIYWKNCPYGIILNTESKKFSFNEMDIKCLQLYPKEIKIPYGKRMLDHLKYINSEYILVMIDDFFLQEQVEISEIEKCKKWMDQNSDIAVFYFSPVKDSNNIISSQYAGYEKRPKVGVYKVNFQAALWRTSDFRRLWKKHESPWDWEKCGTFRSFFDDKEYYVRSCMEKNPINYGAAYGEAWNIVAGLWCVDSVHENFVKNEIHIDYSKRGILTCAISELPRDNKKRTITDEINKARSIGIKHSVCEFSWRMIRYIKKKMRIKTVETDYYEHLSKIL